MADNINSMNNDPIIANLEKALDGTTFRHKVISNNIANVDTPQFKRSDVSFLDELRKSMSDTSSLALKTTHSGHLSSSQGSDTNFRAVQDTSTTFRKDGNNVDIEREMAEMTKNNVMYNAYVQLLISHLTKMKSVIAESGR
jgi:flagellar basal-body rod protein FlgB